MRLIDANALYERTCELEAQALAYIEKINNDETKVEEWRTWSAILAERTAFKHDIYDAPTIEPERKTGKWKVTYLDHEAIGERPRILYCSECNQCIAYPVNFCPSCGARMGGDR